MSKTIRYSSILEIGNENVSHFTLPTVSIANPSLVKWVMYNWYWHRHTYNIATICNQHFQTWPRPLIFWNQQPQQLLAYSSNYFCH